MKTSWTLALAACALLAGCASSGEGRHADELSANRLDNDYCVSHGLNYPDPAYVQCRWTLANSRYYRQWKSSQMLNRASQPAGGPARAIATPEPQFRPLDREHFQCRLEPQFGGNYVFCGPGPGAGTE